MSTGRVLEKALGGGNCAFNAFILGIAEPEILDQIEENLKRQKKDPNVELKDFIKTIGQTLLKSSDAHWDTIKQALIHAKKSNKTILQNQLNHPFRLLAISRIEIPEFREQHYKNTLEPLLVEFENYFNQIIQEGGLKNRSTIGDIFIRHEFIEETFEVLTSAYNDNLEQAKKALEKWWKEQGHNIFLGAMKLNGVWAGDLELAALSNYLGINLDVIRIRFNKKFQINFNYGILDTKEMNPETIKQLIVRQVIDKTPVGPNQHRWAQHFAEVELNSILSSIPGWKKIENHFSLTTPLSIRNKRVTLSNHLKKILFETNIIQEDKEQGYVYCKEASEIWPLLANKTLSDQDQDEIQDEMSSYADPMKNAVLPFEMGSANLAMMGARGILKAKDNQFVFALTRANASLRASALNKASEIISAWQISHIEQPTITLQNNFGDHWDNIQNLNVSFHKPEVKQEQKEKEKYHTDLRTCEQREQYARTLFAKKKSAKTPSFKKLLADEDRKSNNRIVKMSDEKLKEAIQNKKLFVYHKEDKKILFISRTSQIKLDKALAFEMQKAFYEEKKGLNP